MSGEDLTFSVYLHDQFEVVYGRITKGRHDMKRLKQYMEDRAAMSLAFAKSLRKACEQPDFEDSSSLATCWKDIRDTSTQILKNHETTAATCTEIAAALEKQIVEVKTVKTKLHALYTKTVADVKKKQQMHDKAREVYYESVKQAETAVMNKDAAVQQQMPEKTVKKAEEQARAKLKDVENYHAAYKKSVESLQEAQTTFDNVTIDVMQQFEKLERQRLSAFLANLDRFAHFHDSVKAIVEGVVQTLHSGVNAVNTDADVNAFIRANHTNAKPPPHVEYVPMRSPIIHHALDYKPPAASASAAATTTNSLPPPPPPSSASNSSSSSNSSATPAGPPPVPAAAAAAASAPAAVQTAVALYDFDVNEPDDLPFKAGQTITLINCDDAEDWWQGEIAGKVGIFPKTYVQKQAAATVPASVSLPPPVPVAAAPAPVVEPEPIKEVPAAVAAQPPPPPPVNVQPPPAAPVSSNPFGEDEPTPSPAASVASTPAAAAEPAAEAAADQPKLLDAVCQALYDFEGQDSDELTFKAGQTLIITGELNGWYLGRVDGDQKVGIFPSNYVSLTQ